MTQTLLRGILLNMLLLITSTLLLTKSTYAQPGTLDSSFGNNGLLIFQKEASQNGSIVKVLPAASGSYYVVYQNVVYDYDVFNQVAIVKYTKDSVIDSSYGSNGISVAADVSFTDAAIQADGKIIVVGNTDFTYYADPNFQTDIIVVRYDTNGSLDNSFSFDGLEYLSGTDFSYDYAKIITFKGDQIVIGGIFNTLVGGFGGFLVYVISSDGNYTQSIQVGPLRLPSSTDPYNYAQAITIQGDKIIVAGFDDGPSSDGGNFSVYRFYSNGLTDSTFGGIGYIETDFGAVDRGFAVASQNDKIIVAGSTFNYATGNTDFAIARYNDDGSLDKSFNGSGKQVISFGDNAEAKSIIIKDGKIIIGGYVLNAITGNNEFALARLDSTGNLDTSFDLDGKQTTGLMGASLIFDQLYLDSARLFAAGLGVLNNTSEIVAVIAAYELERAINLSCPADTVIFTDKGNCSAIVKNIDPSVSSTDDMAVNYTLSGATTGTGTGTASGKLFNKGTTIVTYTSASNSMNSCSFAVIVVDNELPVIKNVVARPDVLWPPNHKMRDVDVEYQVSDNCGATSVLSITSNEPQSGTGTGDIPNDWQILDANHVRLRAERSNDGNGRIYTITITTTDASGNKTSKQVQVEVPRYIVNDNPLKAKAYPNPTTSYFTILTQTENTAPILIKVSDAFGRIAEVKNKVAPNATVQLGANYSPGLYFAEIMQGSNKVTLILVKLPGGVSGK